MILVHVFEDFSGSLNSFDASFGVNQAPCHAEVSPKSREAGFNIKCSGAGSRLAHGPLKSEIFEKFRKSGFWPGNQSPGLWGAFPKPRRSPEARPTVTYDS